MNNILIWRHFVILVSFKRRRSLTSGGGAGIFKCQFSLLCGETKMAESSTAMEDGQDWKMAEAQAMEQDEQVETGWETGADGAAADGGSTECHNWGISYPEDTPHFKWTEHASDDENDYEFSDTELELAEHSNENCGLKQLGTYFEDYCKDNPNDPILGVKHQSANEAQNPLTELAQWPMGGYTTEEALQHFQNSSIGSYFITKFPVKPLTEEMKDCVEEGTIIIHNWRDIFNYLDFPNLTPDHFTLLKKNSTFSKTLSVAVAQLWGWLPHEKLCTCGGTMKIGFSADNQDRVQWRCCGKPGKNKKGKSHGHSCQKKKSVRHGNFLINFRQNLGSLLHAIYLWYTKPKITLLGISQWSGIPKTALDKLTKACRLIVANFMVQNPEILKIGGVTKDQVTGQFVPIRVQIDETACGKMKYHKGKKRIQTWVLGGMEDPKSLPSGQKPKSFALSVPNRSRATLIPCLKFFIEAGSTVWSDGWSSYFCLVSHGFPNYNWVNHSKFFKDPVTGVNTNAIEGHWKWLKNAIPDGSRRRDIEEYVCLYNFKEWTKTHKNFNNLGSFAIFSRACANVKLNDQGKTGDKVANMSNANRLVALNPLPLPPAPEPKAKYIKKSGKGRGRGRGKAQSAEAP